jgi:hypothetical protein
MIHVQLAPGVQTSANARCECLGLIGSVPHSTVIGAFLRIVSQLDGRKGEFMTEATTLGGNYLDEKTLEDLGTIITANFEKIGTDFDLKSHFLSPHCFNCGSIITQRFYVYNIPSSARFLHVTLTTFFTQIAPRQAHLLDATEYQSAQSVVL